MTASGDRVTFGLKTSGRIGLFGGTFDPPHWGHIRAALGAADELDLDQMAFLPAVHPPHKHGRSYSPFDLRCRMIEFCLNIDPRFRLCMIEADENLPGTTYETVQKLREFGYTEDVCHLIWLMGSDSLLDLSTWHCPDKILESVEVAVMPRPGFPVREADSRFVHRVKLLDTPLTEISAQEICSREIRLGESVPAPVAQFIIDTGLYGFSH